jgi:hypothetical protein
MNTDTGRIYEPDEYSQRLEAMASPDLLRNLTGELADQREFTEALTAGKIVEVSETVAQKVRLGERELERRDRRRKAAKHARKAQRS